MRILMLSWEFPPYVVGGLGAHVAALVPALTRQGVQVSVVTPRWRGGEPESRLLEESRVYRVEPSPMTPGNFYADAQQTNLHLEAVANGLWETSIGAGQGYTGFDLIHAHDWLVAFAAIALKQLHKTPLLATIHATERGRGRGHLTSLQSNAINGTEWRLAYEAWRVITASQFMADEVRNYFQIPADKIEIVPNGIDTARFDGMRRSELEDFRARWARPQERLVFFVGRLQHEKGAQVLVEAIPRVLADFPNAKFVIAGTGILCDSLRQRTRELGISDRVAWPGFVADGDRDHLFKVADVAVFPSLYEPFGIVALEAMAAQCPVVVTAVGGLREVVRHGETGLTVLPENVDSLAWGIRETLLRPDRAAARAANAYREARKKFNWDYIAACTLEIYQRIISERAQATWV